MNGPIAQIVALTCHGNALLSGHAVDRSFADNSSCQFCEYIRFVERRWGLFGRREVQIADGPDAWIRGIEASRAAGIRLSRTPQNEAGFADRMLAGLTGGGGVWTMEVIFPAGRAERWTSCWEVGDRDAPDRRIWRVTYARAMRRSSASVAPVDIAATIDALVTVLSEAEAFAARHALDGFRTCFQNALDSIASRGERRYGYHPDLAPPSVLSAEAISVLDACQAAWVFGGMGSWNDLAFEGEEQRTYERLSEALFQAVTQAIARAATSSMPARPGT